MISMRFDAALWRRGGQRLIPYMLGNMRLQVFHRFFQQVFMQLVADERLDFSGHITTQCNQVFRCPHAVYIRYHRVGLAMEQVNGGLRQRTPRQAGKATAEGQHPAGQRRVGHRSFQRHDGALAEAQ